MQDYNDLINPLDVTPEENKGYKEKRYTWAQTYQTVEIDTLANDAGADAELSDQPVEEEPEPENIDDKPVMIMINRHNRRKQAKLARRLSVKAKMEAAQRGK